MRLPPRVDIDIAAFDADPYPTLARLQSDTPVAYVPQLDAVLLTRRDDVFFGEKRIDVLSSDQPDGLMTRLMGQNMMRKDGDAHMAERRAIFPSVSPRTVRDHWAAQFRASTARILEGLSPRGSADLVADYAMPVSAEALKAVTGLVDMPWRRMDQVSQAMIDGCANYVGDPDVEERCHSATAEIDRQIACASARGAPVHSLLGVQQDAGLDAAQISANIKLAISGGQNEPRDAIAGAAWAAMVNPDVLPRIAKGQLTWMQVFEEYGRWMSPIGMSPRRVAQDAEIGGYHIAQGQRVFLMFGAANRDPGHFDRADQFVPERDTGPAVTFGAGPHFCAGAWISRALIGEIALPMLFERLQNLRLSDPVAFRGWAFRGPIAVPVTWTA